MAGRPHEKYVYPGLADWMKRKGLTQYTFADMLGIGQPTVSSFLRGKSVLRIETI